MNRRKSPKSGRRQPAFKRTVGRRTVLLHPRIGVDAIASTPICPTPFAASLRNLSRNWRSGYASRLLDLSTNRDSASATVIRPPRARACTRTLTLRTRAVRLGDLAAPWFAYATAVVLLIRASANLPQCASLQFARPRPRHHNSPQLMPPATANGDHSHCANFLPTVAPTPAC